ncbi:unnamed protein product [Prorocentrum cordatum]|uniref:Kinesin motor domain-containing protein n=1 Tax=Prorocentrum cordatum TaxID=2364126 RepID=A0ABN9RTF3_9DINO|nr:unnamed protein product [Polarella glacialis]
MVANVSPNHVSYEDTLNTLKYANRAKNIRVSAQQNIVEPDAHVSQYEKAIADLRSEVSLLKARLAKRQTAPGGRQALAGWQEEEDAEEAEQDGSGVQEASENWKIEVVRNLEGRTQLQRSLIEVDRGLSRWRVEQAQAREAIDGWNESQGSSSPYTPRTVARRARPSVPTLEDWKDQLSQIEESIREHEDTRRKIEEKLDQNKVQGKELHAQLAQRVLNEDLRAFLEMIQRVQVLEVERLELDHLWERQRSQLEERDQEIVMLREQLRLRNVHIGEQRELLSAERQQLLPLPGRVSLLGTTLAQGSPGQQRGPLRVMQAWAPPPTKDQDEVPTLSSRPLRATSPRPRSPGLEGQKPGGEFPIGDLAPQLPCPGLPINWRNLELPKASQIHGIARIFADGGALDAGGGGGSRPRRCCRRAGSALAEVATRAPMSARRQTAW